MAGINWVANGRTDAACALLPNGRHVELDTIACATSAIRVTVLASVFRFGVTAAK